MGNDTIPPEFLEPEGDAERQDPDLVLETTSATLRALWKEWMCRRGDGSFADVEFFGRKIGGVPTPAVDAYQALEVALRSAGYKPDSRWAYNCRLIEGTDQPSLHSAGIAWTSTRTRTPTRRVTRSPGSSVLTTWPRRWPSATPMALGCGRGRALEQARSDAFPARPGAYGGGCGLATRSPAAGPEDAEAGAIRREGGGNGAVERYEEPCG